MGNLPSSASLVRFFPLALGLTALGAAGCASYVPFTQELRDLHDLQTADLKNLQFYNSHTITLRHEVERGGREVTGGHKLLVIAGKQIEEVEIPAHTPGVVVGADDSTLEVSFDEGTSFKFRLRGPEPVKPSRGPPPGLRHAARSVSRQLAEGGATGAASLPWAVGISGPTESGQLTFQGRSWDAIGESLNAHLVISTE